MILRCTLLLLYLLNKLQQTAAQLPENSLFTVHYKYMNFTKAVNHSQLGTIVGNDSFSITFDSILIVELGSDHLVMAVTLIVEYLPDECTILLTLRWKSHLSKGNNCPRGLATNTSIEFNCHYEGRLVQIETNKPLTVYDIKVNARATYIELFVGCFKHDDNIRTHVVSNVSECIYHCNYINYTYAGVKNWNCGCYNQLYEYKQVEVQNCHILCGFLQLCTIAKHIPIYFADYEYLRGAENISIDCILDEKSCDPCKPGYKGILCDIRDCSVNNGDCGSNQCFTYNDTFVHYDSICKCKPGFQNDLYSVCTDINECYNHGGCTWRQICWNSAGSFGCMCRKGYNETGPKECIDIDECTIYSVCDQETSTCLNNDGSYECKCKAGYQPDNVTEHVCIDIDECEDAKAHCPLNCTNLRGSFYCRCPIGFQFIRSKCEDIDECTVVTLCDLSTTSCHNTYGSFGCNCSKGYSRATAYKCEDIDECHLNIHNCDTTATCKNIDGGYACICQTGLVAEIYNYISFCEDIDECRVSEAMLCNINNSVCMNTYGSFTCECITGFKKLRNLTCTPVKVKLTSTVGEVFTPEYFVSDDDGSADLRMTLYAFITLFLLLAFILYIVCATKKPSHRPRMTQYRPRMQRAQRNKESPNQSGQELDEEPEATEEQVENAEVESK